MLRGTNPQKRVQRHIDFTHGKEVMDRTRPVLLLKKKKK
jgi:hypothetical protein